MAAYGQFLGGISILLGLLARLGTLPLIVNMLVAIATVHAKNGFSIQNGGYEFNLNLIAESLLILIAGPGIISLDALLLQPRPLGQRPAAVESAGAARCVKKPRISIRGSNTSFPISYFNLALRHPPQHRVQNAAVAVVIHFHRRIDAAGRAKFDLRAVRFAWRSP